MSLPASYFERMYADSADPWGFATRWYEQRKRALTVAALPQERYERGFEPGCSIGLLTAELAPRCAELLATDVADRAVAAAASRVPAHVRVQRLAVPAQWPEGDFDLVVLSELGYYLDRDGLARLVRRTTETLRAGGTLLACHWRHPVADYPLTGDDVHQALLAAPGLSVLARHEEADFRLDVLMQGPAVSVATRAGLT